MSENVWVSLFGRVSWAPPAWLARMGVKRVLAVVLGVALLALLAWGVARYYQNLPKPPTLVATASAPSLSTFTDDQLNIRPLNVRFEVVTDPREPTSPVTSVAALDKLDADLETGVSIEPALDGVWRWHDEKTLRFVPAADWPAGQDYTVTYDASLFAPNLRLDDTRVSFTTRPFEASLDSLEFYQDPVDTDVRKVVASLSFTHPVDETSLRDAVSMAMRDANETVETAPTEVAFDVRLGPHGRTAYLHSTPLTLPPSETYMNVTIESGVASSLGSVESQTALADRVRIPDTSSYFRVKDLRAQLVRDDDDDPVQTLSLVFTDRVSADALANRLSVYRLPRNPTIDGEVQNNKYWRSPRELTPDVLSQSQRVDVTLNPVEGAAATLHSLRLDQPENAVLYVRIEPGLVSAGEFAMVRGHDALARVPAYPKEATIAQAGALLPLTGTHRLTLVGRGVDRLKVEVGRVLDGEIHHLASQTGGDIKSARFSTYRFQDDNIVERSERFIDLSPDHPSKATFAQLDLTEFLPRGGFYVITVQGWDRNGNHPVGQSDRRLIMISDIGLLAKASADGAQDVFVHSIASGRPMAGARVSLLGKNGLPILERLTDARGHASMPPVRGFEREKTPTVFVVRKGSDSIFMPFNRYGRRLQYSRFDVGGDRPASSAALGLRAMVFTDRGLYRPGETVQLAAIIKREDWGTLSSLPIAVRIVGPRGNTVHEHRQRLPGDGLMDIKFATEAASATGNYNAYFFVIDREQRQRSIGNASFSVEEFQPDRLRIAARLVGQQDRGWVKPGDLRVGVQLDNLFGSPAQGRRVAGTLELVPSGIRLPDFPEYRFDDPLRRDGADIARVSDVLPDAQTDETGHAELLLDVSRFDRGIYRLSVNVEGFEEGGGRSVRARTGVMMSPLDVLVGYRSDSDLAFLSKDSSHRVDLIGVNSAGEAVAVDELRQQLVAYRFVSTLVERPNGTYAYQSVRQETPVSETAYALPAGGGALTLPTGEAGQFALKIIDANDQILAHIDYTVAGARNLAGNLERDAQLDITLDGESFAPGEEIEMQIVAPYTGTGLITIERDRVIAHRWFTTDTETSVQRIRLPDDIEGNAYVNVAFIRDLASPEVFTSPLSYAVAPFSINRAARTLDVSLDVPERVEPGQTLSIGYQTDRPGRVIVFAVDEGILQVARYQAPEPLDFFLRKLALQVGTYQMVDLILPEFEAWRQRAAPGGGDGADLIEGNLNPFRRRDEPPVALWSGVLDASSQLQTVDWTVPDHFNGTLRVMAVAVNDAALGHAVTSTQVRGPFVITPSVLTAAAPGDTFEINVGLSNQVEGSGAAFPVELGVTTSEHLSIDGEATQKIAVDEGSEGRAIVRLKANDVLGPASVTLTASNGSTTATRTVSLSIRPPVAFVSTVETGQSSADPLALDFARTLYPQFAQQRVAASASPLVLADGLLDYVDAFPHSCAEQMVSKVFPQVGLLGHGDVDLDEADVRAAFDLVIKKLRPRQLPNGGFCFWLGASEAAEFPSVYILHFLADAAERNLPVPRPMRQAGLNYLQELAGRSVTTLAEARVRAYAIYVLTRHEIVTTGSATALHEWLDENHTDTWRADIVGSHLAATYALLKQDSLAEPLINAYAFRGGDETNSDFDTRLSRDAQHVYLTARHFPERAAALDASQLAALTEPVMAGRFNTLSSAFTILALGEVTRAAQARGDLPPLTLTTGAGEALGGARAFARADAAADVRQVQVSGAGGRDTYYAIAQRGFDRAPPGDAQSQGIELDRAYLDADGEAVTDAHIGDELTVRLRVRALGAPRSNVAITDLLPGGVEVLTDSVRRQFGGWRADHVDVREDRVVVYGSIGTSVTELSYRVKLTSAGTFAMPSAFAAAMYDRSAHARTKPASLTVQSR